MLAFLLHGGEVTSAGIREGVTEKAAMQIDLEGW